MVLQSYHRLEAWAEDLSRLKFAIAVGIASSFWVFIVSLLLEGLPLATAHAVTMGVTMVVVYYALDPR